MRLPFGPTLVNRTISSVAGNLRTSWDLVRRVSPQVTAGDLVLLCRPLSRTRVAYGLWLRLLRATGRPVTVVYVVHNEPEPLFRGQVRFLRRSARGHRLRFVAHSPAIAAVVAPYLGFKPDVIALPFKAPDFVESAPLNNRPVRLAFLGMGHRSKGLDLVLQALELSAALVGENRLQFAIQCYLPFRDAPSERLHRDIKALAGKLAGVEVIARELSPSEYLQQVTQADIVLVPNRLDTYKFAISGVFADAMGAGRPVIVADGSYVSELVRESGAGVLFEDGNGLSLQHAIVEAAGRIEELLERAKAARLRWVQEQGPAAFVTRVLQLQESPLASLSG